MPKRPKSPEPVEDSKFLAVVHPYPLNANMEVPNDFKEFIYWIACITGKDYVLGVHYKPSARGMVIVEITKNYQDFDKLLGEHRWAEFLRTPSQEEKERRSRVYYSAYSNARSAQKDGWKYLHADDELFKELVPRNQKIRYPYPTSHWCDVPYEDPTNKSLCRPLPAESKAPPPKPPVLVPGSSSWISKRAGIQEEPRAKDQKGGASKSSVGAKAKLKQPVNPDAWKTPITVSSTSPISSKSPSSPFAANVAPTSAVVKPLSPRSAGPSPSIVALSPPGITTPPGLISRTASSPPGLGAASGSSSRKADPPGSPSTQTRFSTTSIAPNAPPSISSIIADDGYDDDSEEEDEFEFPNVASVTLRSLPPPSSPNNRTKGKIKEEQPENLWTKVPVTTTRSFRKVIEEEDMCPVHGVLCSKGICSVMKKKQREKERLMKTAARGPGRRRKADENDSNGEGEGERGGGSKARDGEGEAGKGRTGYWGPKKERNAKQRGDYGDNLSESGFSSTRPTIGSVNRESPAPVQISVKKRNPESGVAKSKGKGKAKDTRLWSDRVEEGEESDLSSVHFDE